MKKSILSIALLSAININAQTPFTHVKYKLPDYNFANFLKVDSILYGLAYIPNGSDPRQVLYIQNLYNGEVYMDSISPVFKTRSAKSLKNMGKGKIFIDRGISVNFSIYHTDTKMVTDHDFKSYPPAYISTWVENDEVYLFFNEGCKKFDGNSITTLGTYCSPSGVFYASAPVVKYNNLYYFIDNQILYRSDKQSVERVCGLSFNTSDPNYGAWCVVKNNQLYITTNHGLLRYENDTVVRTYTGNSNLKEDFLLFMLLDGNNELYTLNYLGNEVSELCRFNGNGVFEYEDFKFSNFPIKMQQMTVDNLGSITAYAIDPTDGKFYFYIFNPKGNLGLKDNQTKSSIAVYPNPASDFITVNFEKPIKSLVITDLKGTLINEIKLNDKQTNNSVKIYTSSLANGEYIVQVHFADLEVQNVKFQIHN